MPQIEFKMKETGCPASGNAVANPFLFNESRNNDSADQVDADDVFKYDQYEQN